MLLFALYLFLAGFVWVLQCVLPTSFRFLDEFNVCSGWLILVLIKASLRFPDEALIMGLFCGLLLDFSEHGVFGFHFVLYGMAAVLVATQASHRESLPLQFIVTAGVTFFLIFLDYLPVFWHGGPRAEHSSLRTCNRILFPAVVNSGLVLLVFPSIQWAWQAWRDRPERPSFEMT